MKLFSGRQFIWQAAVGLAVACVFYPPCVQAGGSAGANATLMRKLDSLAQRLDSVESENRVLRSEVSTLKRQVDSETPTVNAMQTHLTQTMPQHEQKVAAMQQNLATVSSDVKKLQEEEGTPGTEWGARMGWQGMPFHQRHAGGFYYGVFFDHRLLTQETDGIPFGDLDGEIMISYGHSETEENLGVSTALLGPQKVEYRQKVVSINAGPKYFLNLWQKYGLRPYADGGPAIDIAVITTPGLVAGQVPLPPQLAARKLPNVGSADVFGGVWVGSGFQYSLADTGVPIIRRLTLGFDYRHQMLENGASFNMFAFQVAAGL
jgi:hypothetical protein